MSEEIAHAKNQTGIAARKFDKSQSNSNRPLSQLSDNSDESNKSQFDVSLTAVVDPFYSREYLLF